MAGRQFYATLSNIDAFIQNLTAFLPKKEIADYWKEGKQENKSIMWSVITEDGLIESEGKFFSITDTVKTQWSKYMSQDSDCFAALTEERIQKNNVEDFGNISSLSKMFNEAYITSCVMSAGEEYFSFMTKYLNEYIDEPKQDFEKLFSLSDKYPISFDVDEYEEMIREKNGDEPYISFEYSDLTGKHNDYFSTSFWMKGDCLTVIIHFNNMEKLGTIHYSILENSGIDVDSNYNFTEYKKFKVSWGDWVGGHSCELKFQKLTSKMASFKVKVWADYDPNCVGIIEGM